jgi:hypothetical protein
VVLPSLRGVAEFFLGDSCHQLCRVYLEVSLHITV